MDSILEKQAPIELLSHHRRLKWTLGLFAIGLIVPIFFLLPLVYNQAKFESLHSMEAKAHTLIRHLHEYLEQRSSTSDPSAVEEIVKEEFSSSKFSKYGGKLTFFRDNQEVFTLKGSPKTWLQQHFPNYAYSKKVLPEARHLISVQSNFNTLEFQIHLYSDKVPFGKSELLATLDILILLLTLIIGLYAAYRIGKGQLALVRQQRNFVSAVSHELRTPLTSIRMHAEILESRRAIDDETRKRSALYIESEASRLQKIIENILVIGRFSDHHTSNKLKKLPLTQALDYLCESIELFLESEDIGFSVVLSESLRTRMQVEQAYLLVHREQFLQIFLNLFDNAVKFSKGSSKQDLELELKQDKACQEVCFTVRDFGSGITDSHPENLFSLFYRSEHPTNESSPGTGIGLSVVRELVRSMNGRVLAQNHDKGAEFLVHFPIEFTTV